MDGDTNQADAAKTTKAMMPADSRGESRSRAAMDWGHTGPRVRATLTRSNVVTASHTSQRIDPAHMRTAAGIGNGSHGIMTRINSKSGTSDAPADASAATAPPAAIAAANAPAPIG